MNSVVDKIQPAVSLHKEDSTEFYLRLASLTSLRLNTVERSRYYTVIWIQEGYGRVKYEFREHTFAGSCILFLSPYQPYVFTEGTHLSGVMLQFASDFYCIERYHHETLCSGVLFNNIYEAPFVSVNNQTEAELSPIVRKLQEELINYQDDADRVLLQALLKIFLIQATRTKKSQSKTNGSDNGQVDQHLIYKLKALIETRYRELKKPSGYADLLSVSVGALNKIAQKHFSHSLTELIQERVVLEAKRELILTDKHVKTIAYELGYDDEYYFSRLFSKLTGLSPTQFRKSYHWME